MPADDAVLIRQSVPSTTPGEEPSPIGNSPGRYKVLISDSTPLWPPEVLYRAIPWRIYDKIFDTEGW